MSTAKATNCCRLSCEPLEKERKDVASINNIQIWSPAAQKSIPIRQVVSRFDTTFEDEIIQRLNRKSTITVHADPDRQRPPKFSTAFALRWKTLDMGPDYELEWWGEYRDSTRAQAGIAASLPMFLLMMVLIVLMMFNAIRQPLIIWLIVPLALIGVTGGLLVGQSAVWVYGIVGIPESVWHVDQKRHRLD